MSNHGPHFGFEVYRVSTGEIIAPDVNRRVALMMVAAADTELAYRSNRVNTEK